ncbi:MAG: GntR family transcriptional regulator [Acidobacteria bacterium]|nr:GntR family transcriptional regulator [Acidobacteriota bacterium]
MKIKEAINARSPVAIPEQLKKILLSKIESGEYIPGEKIPSERALAEMYGISRISARQTLTELIAEDYLFRIPGKGTFVERAEQVARKLKRGSFNIAFLINRHWYSFAQPGHNRVLEGVERALSKRGYKLVFLASDDRLEEGQINIDLTRRRAEGYDGYILEGPMSEQVIEYFQASDVAFILLDAVTAVDGVNCVCMDYFGGAIQAIRYLAKLGHSEIGYIGLEHSDKYHGYLEGLRTTRLKHDASFTELITINGEDRPGYQHGREAMQRLISRGAYPSALFITNDVVALGAMEVAKREGIKIPQQLSLVGCDDIDIFGQADPPLTTVCTDLERFGAVGVERLFSLMETPNQSSQIIRVPLHLVVRGSVTAPSRVAASSIKRDLVHN